jgi:hypothetical protein
MDWPMRVPVIHGLIRRRLLINFRVDAGVMKDYLPAPFEPKLHEGHAIAGICLIRLEGIRPRWLPPFLGLSSENAAHRIAVEWADASGQRQEGVFIPRRDTSSRLNHIAGGRLFPGEHELSDFDITDADSRLEMDIRSHDGSMSIFLKAHEAESDSLPSTSCFASLSDSSTYFMGGSIAYSVTHDCCRLDGMRLETVGWHVRPVVVEQIHSTFFSNSTLFPEASVCYDHALIMRNHLHQWHSVKDLFIRQKH